MIFISEKFGHFSFIFISEFVMVTVPSFCTVQMSWAVNSSCWGRGFGGITPAEGSLSPSPAQVWDQGLATHCPLCSRAAPAASELEGAFSSMDINCCQDESLTGFYCTPIFELLLLFHSLQRMWSKCWSKLHLCLPREWSPFCFIWTLMNSCF